VNSN
jgi:hypothetical protein